jgi:hypothetical protein
MKHPVAGAPSGTKSVITKSAIQMTMD